MKQPFPLLLVCLFLTFASTWAEESPSDKNRSPVPPNINESFLDPDKNPEEWVNRFEVESREIFSSREEILKALHLKEGDRIADVGAGTGLFAALFSEAVKDQGKVYAVDISPTLIQFMKTRFRDDKWKNIEVVFSKEDSVELPEDSVDVLFICDTYHHFEFHEAMLASIFKALRPGGKLVLIEFIRAPGVSSDWVLGHVRAGKAEFRSEIENAGFRFLEEVAVPGLTENYFLRFEKP